MCAVWLATEDIGSDAGPLFYYPGSHRWPIMTNALIGRQGYGSDMRSAQDPYGPAWRALSQAYEVQEDIFLARKEQIWCPNLLHGGSHQNDPSLARWSQVTHYYFDDCIYYTPAFSGEALGWLQPRDLVAVSDGKRRSNSYLGEAVEGSTRSTLTPAPGLSLRRRLLKRLHKE